VTVVCLKVEDTSLLGYDTVFLDEKFLVFELLQCYHLQGSSVLRRNSLVSNSKKSIFFDYLTLKIIEIQSFKISGAAR